MSIALGTIAENLAARYAPGALPATPSGAATPRSSSANLTNQLGALPLFLVFPEAGHLDQYPGGARQSVHRWWVRLYYAQLNASTLERDTDELRDWTALLLDQLVTGAGLGGSVTIARTTDWKIGRMDYAGVPYIGAELAVETVTNDHVSVTL